MNWRKSSYSGQSGGNCVAIADGNSRILVRDTKDSQGPVLKFSADSWRKFADQVKTARLTVRQGSKGTSR